MTFIEQVSLKSEKIWNKGVVLIFHQIFHFDFEDVVIESWRVR